MQYRQIEKNFYKNRLQVLCIFYAIIISVGVTLAILLSDDPRWMNWSLSRLGETSTNRLSALSFNIGVFLSSLVMAVIGVFMTRSYYQLGQRRSAQASGWLVASLTICMLGVALCPNDTMHAAHFFFSRGVVILMVVLMFVLPSSLSYLTHRERLLSFSFPVFAALLAMQGYLMGRFWFVIIEVFLGIFAMVWLFLVCRRIDIKLADVKLHKML
jgi:hypothetical protein cdiviTM7_00788